MVIIDKKCPSYRTTQKLLLESGENYVLRTPIFGQNSEGVVQIWPKHVNCQRIDLYLAKCLGADGWGGHPDKVGVKPKIIHTSNDF